MVGVDVCLFGCAVVTVVGDVDMMGVKMWKCKELMSLVVGNH